MMMMGSSVFVGSMLIGLGIGLVFDHPGPGVLIGLGIGFLMMGITAPTRQILRRRGHRGPFGGEGVGEADAQRMRR